MSIGGTLAEARRTAGLSVAEVSARTRIRGSLIRAIEGDDFGPCGGDFYARGHIRAIARVVGVDSRPLIASYDEAHPEGRPVTMEDLLHPPPEQEQREPRQPW
ncbi:MAG: helix-turn-helix domain-containing protein, partial [Nocardiopsaceae bacterium]|nr:helix-turn-helix domain-containing protein [Nocardiopsaceae bacterium]